jgi:hypothetical protein
MAEGRLGPSCSFVFIARKETADQRDTHIHGHEQEILNQSGSLLDSIVNRVCLGSFRHHDGRYIFQEVNAAFLASTAVSLFMATRRALITKRSVTASTEARDISNFRFAFGTLHTPILENVRENVGEHRTQVHFDS